MLQILGAGTIDREDLKLLEQPDSTTNENHIYEADALILRLTPVGKLNYNNVVNKDAFRQISKLTFSINLNTQLCMKLS